MKFFPVNVFRYEPFEGEMVVIAKIEKFTDELRHLPGERSVTMYSLSIEGRRTRCNLQVFTNGFSESTKGHVFIVHYNYLQDLELCCIISVIDVLGNKRFSRSFIIESMRKQEKVIIPYISRETLLSDPDELLPNDTLTLNISMPFNSIYEAMLTERFLRCFGIDNTFHINHSVEKLQFFSLNMDSSLAMWLKEESSYFRGITNARYSCGEVFDANEFWSFQHIEKIITKERILAFGSVKEIFDLWFVAHKYDIPAVIESCRGFLKLCLFNHTIDDYHRLINECTNIRKRELIEEINAMNLIDFDQDIERSAKEIRLKEPIRGRQWIYEHSRQYLPMPMLHNRSDESRQYLYFHRFEAPALYFKCVFKKSKH